MLIALVPRDYSVALTQVDLLLPDWGFGVIARRPERLLFGKTGFRIFWVQHLSDFAAGFGELQLLLALLQLIGLVSPLAWRECPLLLDFVEHRCQTVVATFHC